MKENLTTQTCDGMCHAHDCQTCEKEITTHLDAGISREEWLAREWERKEIAKAKNAPRPSCCPKCDSELASGGGYVGEEILYCPNKKCDQGVAWEDGEDAIRRII